MRFPPFFYSGSQFISVNIHFPAFSLSFSIPTLPLFPFVSLRVSQSHNSFPPALPFASPFKESEHILMVY